MKIRYSLSMVFLFAGLSKTMPAQTIPPALLPCRPAEQLQRVQIQGADEPDYPRLIIRPDRLSQNLPAVVDNSSQPYLRPVFSQQGASCGQAASVAYNFCYEINRLRNLPADTSVNQYPSHFVWNFMNATEPYYGEGVSYFHTFDILYDAGTPSIATYGPITMDDSYYWMSGYDGYFEAMHNRIAAVNSIAAGTPAGLQLLKQWLYDHADGSVTGGVANYYAGLSGYNTLPPESPEGGKHVDTSFGPLASHALTIVGYNDSIRIDLNGDGQFTNNLDITGDGIVDMQDWEIGGLKYVNSYGNTWGDAGFCYMLYRTLALRYGHGGIWNNSVHVVFPDTAYTPQLTVKATIRCNKRGRLHIYAGISSDTARYVPDHLLSFTIFNYQGGDYNMAGSPLPAAKTLEFGLDITRLISYIKPGIPARIFLIVDEKDPDHSAEGIISEFSVIHYPDNGCTTFPSSDTPVGITDNSTTSVSTVVSFTSNPVVVGPDTTLLVSPSGTAQLRFTASGGNPPYTWGIAGQYHETDSVAGYNPPEGTPVTPSNPANGFATVPLPFSFTFFGKTFDTLYMHVNGYLMFEKQDMPYHYLQSDEMYLHQIRAIAPAMNRDIAMYSASDYMSVEPASDRVTFRWVLSALQEEGHAEFSATIFRDGSIRFCYGNGIEGNDYLPVTGISNNTKEETFFSRFTHQRILNGRVIGYTPSTGSAYISIDQNGLLNVVSAGQPVSGSVLVTATDRNRIAGEQMLSITAGPLIRIYRKKPDESCYPGVNIPLTVEVKNCSTTPDTLTRLTLIPASANVQVSGNFNQITEIGPGETYRIENTFSLTPADTISQPQPLKINATAILNTKPYREISTFDPALVLLNVSPPVVLNTDHLLHAGEEADINFSICNTGNLPSGNLIAQIEIADPFVSVAGNNPVQAGVLNAWSKRSVSFRVRSNTATPRGAAIKIHFVLQSDGIRIFGQDYSVTIGLPDILLIDLDNNRNSVVHIRSAIHGLDFEPDVINFIDSALLQYKTVFLSLGFFSQNHKLTAAEDSLMVSFIENGGNLYLEGGAFYKQDPATRLRERLGVTGSSQAWAHPADTLIGITGSPGEGININYLGDWQRGENLIASSGAIPWFRDKNTGFDFVVSNDPGGYRTIASSVEFGGTFMFDGPGRSELIKRYLDFLGFETRPLSATFSADKTTICKGSDLSFSPISNGNSVSYLWHFEGGEPDSWDGPGPEIHYPDAGDFDVTLTVSDGIHQNVYTIPEYIHAYNCTGIETQQANALCLSPNPAHDFVNLLLKSIPGKAFEVSVFSAYGTQVYHRNFSSGEEKITLPLYNLKQGLYVVCIRSASVSASAKLVIQ